ncbi:hypothetical protein [Subtercola boreus]|uniref:hypothetical protein n=1 Tax=Subtercola boreus TaxID=120213 RepID=UPI0014749DDC|nr:hypothetical protein [Subtercola boreus]
MTDESSDVGGEALEGELLTRLRVIEDQPLESRSVTYVQLHDELRSRLEGGDSPGARG